MKDARFHRLGPGEDDAMGCVYRNDQSIYRGINAAQAGTVRRLFACGVIDRLVAAGLMTPSILIEEGVGDYPLSVEQAELTPPNLSAELPPSLRRDAGLALVRVARLLDAEGFALRDAGLSGFIVDRYGRPLFHDITAILPRGPHKFPYAEFHANFLGPLRLVHERPELADLVQRAGVLGPDEDMSIRRPRLRWLLRIIAGPDVYRRFVVLSPFGGLLHSGLYGRFIREALRERRLRADGSTGEARWTGALLDDLETRLEALTFENVKQRWTDYHANVDLGAIVKARGDWQRHYQGDREQALIQALSGLAPGTLLDVGANNGYFSMLAAHLGFATTAVDYDIGAIDNLYRLTRAAGASLTIRPLLLDFVNLAQPQWARFEADAVFALGFVHHMRRVELLPWAVIAERLSGLARKILITEFKPGTGASHAKQEVTDAVVDDYTLEHLLVALKRHFRIVEVVGDFTAVGSVSPRTMIVCRK